MKTNDAFVTCIYNGLSRTKFGGRNFRNSRYYESLTTIAATGIPIFCYTQQSDYEELMHVLSDNKINNVTVIIKELKDIRYHNRIQEIKEAYAHRYTDLFWLERCVEIMLGKLIMIEEIIQLYNHLDNVWWIDAGFSHNDVICSPKYCTYTDMEEGRSYNARALFTPRLIEKLKEWLDDKVLLMETTVAHNTAIPSSYNVNPYENHNGAIGGLFGGNAEKMKLICEEFFRKVDNILADELLYGEENILFAVYTDLPELFKTFVFSSWYHEGWGERHNPTQINFSNFFDNILENEILRDELVFTTMAFGERYREISKNFVESFLQYVDSNFKLVIVTDKPDFYDPYLSERIIVKELILPPDNNISFPYNIKYNVIQIARDTFYGCDKIFYLDSDCYFVKKITKNMFAEIKDGLNVIQGTHFTGMLNPAIIRKVESVAKHSEEKDLNSFRECALLFKLTNNYEFNKFLYEWKDIYDLLNKKHLPHIAECTDISIAMKRAKLPIHNIQPLEFYDLRETIFTTVKDIAVRAIL